MEAFVSHLAARELSDELLIAHHLGGGRDDVGVAFHMTKAEASFMRLAERMGYRVEKIEPVAAEQREAA